MQVKIFNIRLKHKKSDKDLKKLNDFLSEVKFAKSGTNFVQSHPPYYSILIYYNPKINEQENDKNTNPPKKRRRRNKDI